MGKSALATGGQRAVQENWEKFCPWKSVREQSLGPRSPERQVSGSHLTPSGSRGHYLHINSAQKVQGKGPLHPRAKDGAAHSTDSISAWEGGLWK